MAELKGAFSVIENVAEGVSGGVGGFGEYAAASWWPVAWFWLKIAFWIIFVVFAVLIWWKFFKQYKVRVGLRIRSGGGIVEIKDDKAKIIKDKKGRTKLVLFKTRKGTAAYTCPIPLAKYKLKKGKLDYYDLELDDNNQLQPIEVGIGAKIKAVYSKEQKELNKLRDQYNQGLVEGKLKPFREKPISEEEKPYMQVRPQDRDSWVLDDIKLEHEMMQKKTWVQEYLPLIVITTLSVTVILVFFFLFQNIGTGMSSLASSFSAIARSCTGLG